MNDGIERAERVNVGRQLLSPIDSSEIAGENRFCAMNCGEHLPGACLVASVQDHLMAQLDQKLSGHAAEAIG